METKTLNLTIDKYEAKTAKVSGKPYMRFHTENGWITCFDKTISMDIINNSMNVPLSCEVSIGDDERMVLKKVIGTAENMGAPLDPWAAAKPIAKPADNKFFAKAPSNATAQNDKATTMYTSYAKDIFNTIYPIAIKSTPLTSQAIMNEAIALVKQAMDAF